MTPFKRPNPIDDLQTPVHREAPTDVIILPCAYGDAPAHAQCARTEALEVAGRAAFIEVKLLLVAFVLLLNVSPIRTDYRVSGRCRRIKVNLVAR